MVLMLIKRPEEVASGNHSLYYFSYYTKIVCHITALKVRTVSY